MVAQSSNFSVVGQLVHVDWAIGLNAESPV